MLAPAARTSSSHCCAEPYCSKSSGLDRLRWHYILFCFMMNLLYRYVHPHSWVAHAMRYIWRDCLIVMISSVQNSRQRRCFRLATHESRKSCSLSTETRFEHACVIRVELELSCCKH